jgi:predicted RNA-binding protein (virulence factor B family)
MAEDAEAVLLKIHEEYDDLLPFDDKAEPEKIREVFGLSKAAFKRAVGRLYKEKKIVIEEGTIKVL